MLPLRKKISDLKSRPLNWDRVSYVLSKNEYFLSTWGDVMSRKNDPKKSEWGGILTTKRSNFERCHKSDKKMIVLRLKKAKKRPFLATKKNVTKSRSRTGRALGTAGRPQDCNFVPMQNLRTARCACKNWVAQKCCCCVKKSQISKIDT